MKQSTRTIKTVELTVEEIEDMILKSVVPSTYFHNRSIVFDVGEGCVRGCIITAETKGDSL